MDIYSFLGSVAKNLIEPTVNKLSLSIDTLVSSYNKEGEYLPLEINGITLGHSQSPKNANGNMIPNTIGEHLIDKRDVDKATGFIELLNQYRREAVIIANYLTGLSMQIDAKDIDNTAKIAIALVILPKFVTQDTVFFTKCINDNSSSKNYLNSKYHSAFNSKAEEKDFIDLNENKDVFELMEKYYAMTLLTDF